MPDHDNILRTVTKDCRIKVAPMRWVEEDADTKVSPCPVAAYKSRS